ncbi:EAL domain-containing protein [Methylobacter sp.]|uniref:EAL domain-containing protein n=1 Tax=Methylobacter sp. TaxID=2051955 RepID=UPI002FDCDD41
MGGQIGSAQDLMTEADIIEGIKSNKFTFFYQPKVSLVSGKVIGAEALIRWIDSNGTVKLPATFIPVAEQSSLITEITCHMFPKLVKDILVLMDIDEQLVISFNTSVKDFEDDAFIRLVLNTLKISQLPTNKLQIELTETATLQAGDAILKNINKLRNAGLGLAMDDFGTGYSSIDTLSKWPFTTIKLDQGMVGRILDSDKNSTIVGSSIRMAHELGISVVAEGVETNEQYHHLLEAGCTKVQGFWISKPLPLDQFITFVDADIRWSGIPIGLIHMAIIDHVQWRKELVSELVKTASLPLDAPQRKYQKTPPLSCKECRLGQWYYGTGQMFRDRKVFQSLEKSHYQFHEIGQMLVNLVSDGAVMKDLTPHLRDLSEKSTEVLSALQELENEGLIDMHTAHNEWVSHSLNPMNLVW